MAGDILRIIEFFLEKYPKFLIAIETIFIFALILWIIIGRKRCKNLRELIDDCRKQRDFYQKSHDDLNDRYLELQKKANYERIKAESCEIIPELLIVLRNQGLIGDNKEDK